MNERVDTTKASNTFCMDFRASLFFSILNVSIHDSAVHHFDMNESYLTNIILVQFKTEK